MTGEAAELAAALGAAPMLLCPTADDDMGLYGDEGTVTKAVRANGGEVKLTCGTCYTVDQTGDVTIPGGLNIERVVHACRGRLGLLLLQQYVCLLSCPAHSLMHTAMVIAMPYIPYMPFPGAGSFHISITTYHC